MSQLDPVRRQVTVAHAHSGEDTYVFVVAGKHGVSGSVHFPIAVLNQVLELDIPATEQEATAALPPATESIHSYITEHLSVDIDGESVTIDLLRPEYKSPRVGGYVVTDYRTSVRSLERPARVAVEFDGVFDRMPGGHVDLIVRNEYGWGKFTRNDETRLAFDAETSRHELVFDRPSLAKDFAGTQARVRHGISKRLRR